MSVFGLVWFTFFYQRFCSKLATRARNLPYCWLITRFLENSADFRVFISMIVFLSIYYICLVVSIVIMGLFLQNRKKAFPHFWNTTIVISTL